jgi:hypothetical protein
MDGTDKTPLEKVLASIPSTQQMYVRDQHKRIKGLSLMFNTPLNAKPINKLELLYILHAVMSGELKPEDFELWTYEDGVFHVAPDGTCEKLKQWDYDRAICDVLLKMNNIRSGQSGENETQQQ